MRLRTGKHWELLLDNDKSCTDCDKVTATAMRGKTEANKRELLCKGCALRRGDVERQILTSFKALMRYVRGHLTSLIVIMTLNIVLSAGITLGISHERYTRNVRVITEWAYPKADRRLSRNQVEEIIRAHLDYSKKKEHTLAICMAEGRLLPYIEGAKYQIMTGGGQINWDVWGKKLIAAGIVKEKRDLFDPKATAKAVSFILEEYLALLPPDLQVPGIRLTYALTLYVGDATGQAVMRGIAARNQKLSNDALRAIMSKLSYPVEVLAYVGEILEIERHGGD